MRSHTVGTYREYASASGHPNPTHRDLAHRRRTPSYAAGMSAVKRAKFLPSGVPSAGRGRASTRRTLVEVAQGLFTAQGFSATSLDQIVAGAQVTKGALYHHFNGKAALFEAVLDRVEGEAADTIRAAVRDEKDPWDKAAAGLRSFLTVVQEPSYRRIVIQEGPAVLGYERFREQQERSTYAIVLEIVRGVLGADRWDFDEEMQQTFGRIFFGAMSSAGATVATAPDPAGESERVETAISVILGALRLLADSEPEPEPGSEPEVTEE